MKTMRKKQLVFTVALAIAAMTVPRLVANAQIPIVNPGLLIDVAKAVLSPVDTLVAGIGIFMLKVVHFVVLGLIDLLTAAVSALTIKMLEMGAGVLTDPVVLTGWQIVRDVANLGFVLALLAISFGTILRFQTYGMKQLLARLIIAAVLVNFSLLIAGLVIDFSNSLAFAFKPPTGWENFVGTIRGVFQGENFSNLIDKNTTFSGLEALFQLFLATMFAIVFKLMTLVIMAFMGFLFLVRYIHLAILLVLAPLPWLFWTVPNLRGLGSQWWSSFIRWSFFAPAALFFIWLATNTANYTILSGLTRNVDSASLAEVGAKGLSGNVLELVLQMFVLGGLLVGGLMFADRMGIHAAGAGVRMATAIPKGAGAWARRGAGRAKDRAIRRAYEGKEGKAGWLQKTADKLSGSRLTRGISTTISGIAGGSQEREAKFWEGKWKNLTQTQFGNFAKQSSTPGQAAALAVIGQKNEYLGIAQEDGGLDPATRKKMYLQALGAGPEYANRYARAMPSIIYDTASKPERQGDEGYDEYTKDIVDNKKTAEEALELHKRRMMQKFIEEELPNVDAANINHTEFKIDAAAGISDLKNQRKMAALLALSSNQLGKAITEGPKRLVDELKNSLEYLFKNRADLLKSGFMNAENKLDNELSRQLEYWQKSPTTGGMKLEGYKTEEEREKERGKEKPPERPTDFHDVNL